jgi:hypothetical protein
MHPDSPALPMLMPRRASAGPLRAALAELKEITCFPEERARASDNIELRRIRVDTLFCEITKLDDRATYLTYLRTQALTLLPLWGEAPAQPCAGSWSRSSSTYGRRARPPIRTPRFQWESSLVRPARTGRDRTERRSVPNSDRHGG